jgi:hypothetical protein
MNCRSETSHIMNRCIYLRATSTDGTSAAVIVVLGAVTRRTSVHIPESSTSSHLTVEWTEVTESIFLRRSDKQRLRMAPFCHSCSNVLVVLRKADVYSVAWTCDPLKLAIIPGSRDNTWIVYVTLILREERGASETHKCLRYKLLYEQMLS